jgi:S1-C subfamily serine protease
VFYDNGLAVPRNKSSAYVFYKLAATIAGEDYMKIAEKTLGPLCRTDENEAAFKMAFEEIRLGKTINDKLVTVTSLKDIEDFPVTNNQPVAPILNNPPGTLTDSNSGQSLIAKSSGSGLIFSSEGYLFTNNHVVKNGKAFTAKIAGVGEMRSVTLVAADEVHDLAILKIEKWKGVSETGQPIPSLLLSAKDCPIGARVFTVGYPVPDMLNQSPKYSSGDLSSIYGPEDQTPGTMLVTCPVQPGNSGGALVRDDGHVIGIIVTKAGLGYLLRTKDIPQNINCAIRIEYLRQLAERNSIKIPSPAIRVVDPPKVITANSVLVFNWQ